MDDLPVRLRDALADRYEVGDEIGRGGMAVVYRAWDLKVSRDVAVKALRPEIASALGSERFLREIEIAGQLQHPHVVPILDADMADGIVYCVMPLVDGETLRDRIRREGALPVDEAIGIATAVADALGYAHERGFIHRDVKPSNILLSSGHALVTDFGIARAVEQAGGDRLTESGHSIGTPAYMSPEQATGESAIDGRADLYSLGCVLYEMLAGEPPFAGRSDRAILARQISEPPASIEIHRSGLPSELVRTIDRVLAKVPADRPATAREFVRSLRAGSRSVVPIRTLLRAAAVVIAAGISVWGIRALLAPDPPPVLDPDTIMVFPLVDRGMEAGLGADLAVWIEQGVEGAEPLRFIDGWERLDPEMRSDPTALPRDRALGLARNHGAAHYLSGVVQERDSSLSVTLRLHDVASGETVIGRTATAASGEASVYDLALAALLEILPSLLDPGRDIDLTGLRGRDPAAVALYIEGERDYRASRFAAALDGFRRSLEQDPTLAPAALGGSSAANWLLEMREAARLAGLAVELSAQLPEKHVFRARGRRAYLAGQADSALHWLDRALAEDPGSAEVRMERAEVLYHLLPGVFSADSLAEIGFRAAAELDPEFYPPLVHLIEIEARRGELEAAEAKFGVLMQTDAPIPLVQELRLTLDCVRLGPEGFDWGIPARHGHLSVTQVGRRLSAGGAHLPCAISAYRAVLSADADMADVSGQRGRWGALIGLTEILVMRGQVERAMQLVDSAVVTGAGHAARLQMVGALADARLDERVQTIEAGFGGPGHGEGADVLPETHWLLGAWHARREEPGALAAHARALEEAARRGPDPRTELFRDALSAQMTLMRGDTALAIQRLAALRTTSPSENVTWSYGDAIPVERLLLTELLLSRGEAEEALGQADMFDHHEPAIFVMFLPRSLELRAAASDRLGRGALAAQYRSRLEALRGPGALILEGDPPEGGAP